MYVIAKINFFDNEIEQKTVYFASEQEAWIEAIHWFFMEIEDSEFWAEMEGLIAAEKYDQIKQEAFNTDGMINVHKV